MINKIVFIGAGNIATHLAVGLRKRGHTIIQVWSRSKESGRALAKKVRAFHTDNLKGLIPDADLYVLSVPDNAMPKIVSELCLKNKLLVHTSGFHDMHILDHSSDRMGVFYPLQTFTKSRPVNLGNVPFCIEAGNKKDQKLLTDLAMELSSDVRIMNSETRKFVHLAAVFACNYVNYLYSVADDILKNRNISFDILKPLIMETAQKVMHGLPADMQTGPARRGDKMVLNKHAEMLTDGDTRKLYQLLSKKIMNYYKK